MPIQHYFYPGVFAVWELLGQQQVYNLSQWLYALSTFALAIAAWWVGIKALPNERAKARATKIAETAANVIVATVDLVDAAKYVSSPAANSSQANFSSAAEFFNAKLAEVYPATDRFRAARVQAEIYLSSEVVQALEALRARFVDMQHNLRNAFILRHMPQVSQEAFSAATGDATRAAFDQDATLIKNLLQPIARLER